MLKKRKAHKISTIPTIVLSSGVCDNSMFPITQEARQITVAKPTAIQRLKTLWDFLIFCNLSIVLVSIDQC